MNSSQITAADYLASQVKRILTMDTAFTTRKSCEMSGAFSLICALIVFARILVRLKRSDQKQKGSVFIAGLDSGRRTIQQARQRFVTHCSDMIMEGYKATNGGLFYVPSPSGERLMIPTRYIDELKNADDQKADFTASFTEMFEGKYTTIGQKWHLHPNVVKRDLNAKLNDLMPAVESEIRHAFETVIPPCDDWTPLPMAQVFTEIISKASNCMLGGTDLSRNTEWTNTSINFTTDTWLASQRLKQFPSFLRPVASQFIPEMARVRHHGDVSRKVIIPLMERRLNNKEAPVDLLQMLWDGAKGQDKTPEFMAYTALAISFAAIRTSSSVPTHLLYDLCAHPEFIAPLREEIESALADSQRFTKTALNKMVKLDSFMKESQRFNPLTLITFGRVIHKSLPLHDGVVIPAGTFIGIPVNAINQDPNLYPDPETFSPFRFTPEARMAAGQEKQGPASFVSTTATSMNWGYGKHACSGRFFAANEIKVIFAYFILNYDFKLATGTKRPANLAFELQVMADENVEVVVRKRC